MAHISIGFDTKQILDQQKRRQSDSQKPSLLCKDAIEIGLRETTLAVVDVLCFVIIGKESFVIGTFGYCLFIFENESRALSPLPLVLHSG